MKRPILSTILGIMLVTIAAPTAAHPNDTSETEDYQQLAGDFQVDCETNEGGACFDVNADAIAVSLSIDDDITDPTGAYYEVWDANDETLATGSFCGSSDEIDLEALTDPVTVAVWADGPIFGPIDCMGNVGIATTGSITATWHIPEDEP